ncbi:hypothetical protein [Mariniluteicoccus flavus]
MFFRRAARPAAKSRKPQPPRRSLLWKVLGLAGVASVAATGALVARNERARRAYTPDEVRDRLRERHAEAESRD